MFEPVVEKILELINGQIRTLRRANRDAKIAAILLVGGFGENMYLLQRTQKEFSPEYEVLQPYNAWSAVVLGALAWGSDNSIVTKRKLSRSYGQEIYIPWEDKPGREKIPHPITGADSSKVMKWFVGAGQEISCTEPATFPLTVYCHADEPEVLVIDLLAWDPQPGRETAPDARDRGCYEVGKLKIDLDWPEIKYLPRSAAKGTGEYYEVKFRMELLFSTDICFRAVFNDGPTRMVRVNYDD